jgi:hypothetical protein
MMARSTSLKAAGGAIVASGVLLVGDPSMFVQGFFVTKAEAVIGRPLTPMSYAGVARRTTRRAYYGAAAGAAAAGAAAYGATAYGRGCVQVVDAYGRLVTQCY